jgi:hypothetical protein
LRLLPAAQLCELHDNEALETTCTTGTPNEFVPNPVEILCEAHVVEELSSFPDSSMKFAGVIPIIVTSYTQQ